MVTMTRSVEEVAAQVALPNRAWIRWWTGWNTTTSTVAQSSTSRNGWISASIDRAQAEERRRARATWERRTAAHGRVWQIGLRAGQNGTRAYRHPADQLGIRDRLRADVARLRSKAPRHRHPRSLHPVVCAGFPEGQLSRARDDRGAAETAGTCDHIACRRNHVPHRSYHVGRTDAGRPRRARRQGRDG